MSRESRNKRQLHKVNDILRVRRGELKRHAQFFEDNLVDKRVTYYFNSKGVPKRRSIYFYKRNFMHLCGISRYHNGWKGFYEDCLDNRLKTSKALSLQPKYVEPKIDALEDLPKLLDKEHVGFSDGAVVHKNTNYGELVRTRQDLVALGTVEDRTTKNQVPISLINLEASQEGMRKATSDWSKVYSIRVEDIPDNEINMYQKERELDRENKAKRDIANYKNRQKQLQANKEKSNIG